MNTNGIDFIRIKLCADHVVITKKWSRDLILLL